MDETTSSTNSSEQTTTADQSAMTKPTIAAKPIAASTEAAASEHRKAYGTAKTENLRDSGAWRVLLPGAVILGCLLLLAVPLIILVPLFVISLDASRPTHNLTWLWVSMMVIEVAVAAVIIRGLLKIFITQAGNYRS